MRNKKCIIHKDNKWQFFLILITLTVNELNKLSKQKANISKMDKIK